MLYPPKLSGSRIARAFRAAAVRGCLSCRNTASCGRNSPSWEVTASSNRRLCSALGRWPQILTTASPNARENCSEVSGANVAWANAIASSSVETICTNAPGRRRFPSTGVRLRHRLAERIDEHPLVRRRLALDPVEAPVGQHGEPILAERRRQVVAANGVALALVDHELFRRPDQASELVGEFKRR